MVWLSLGSRLLGGSPKTQTEPVAPGLSGQQQVTPIEQNTATASTVFINTKAGQPFETANFLSSAEVEQLDKDVFLIKEAQSLEGELFQIFFYRGGGINISLLDPNLEFARSQAETALRQLIPESDMRLCSLVISVTVPGWLSQQTGTDHSGVDYGLSFCPTGLDII